MYIVVLYVKIFVSVLEYIRELLYLCTKGGSDLYIVINEDVNAKGNSNCLKCKVE